MKKITLIFTLLIVFSACSRKDYIDSLNKKPEITFLEFPDSIKQFYPLQIKFSIFDKDYNFDKISYKSPNINLFNGNIQIQKKHENFYTGYYYNLTMDAHSLSSLKMLEHICCKYQNLEKEFEIITQSILK